MSVQLDRKSRGLLQKVVSEQSFEVMQAVATELLTQWNVGTVEEDTAFKTAANAIRKEERKKALTIFLQELERLAFHDDE